MKVDKETPERRKPIPQVVTLPKKKQAPSKESSDDGNSTVDENASVTKEHEENASNTGNSTGDKNASNDGNSTGNASVRMAANLTVPAVFDPKLEHLMTYYFLALGDQHDVR